MADAFTDDDDALLAELGVEVEAPRAASHTQQAERIIAGFEDIQRFVERAGHAPRHGEGRDIFERLYAVRLDRLREREAYRALLRPLDAQGLLDGAAGGPPPAPDAMTDDELLAELGVAGAATGAAGDVTVLRHVRPRAEIRAAEEVATRERCPDFDRFRPLFEQVERELASGVRQSRRFGRDGSIARGDFFILGGQLVHVAEMADVYRTPEGAPNARLRAIYSNGTESNLLLRSLQAALYKDETGRRLTEPNDGPLFGTTWDDDDVESGTIYVLRSLSDHPYIAQHRALVHKIGVTGGDVATRIAGAAHDATYLLADVDVVATYKLAAINRVKLEGILHRVFAPAQLDLSIDDRFGNPVRPREWFLVPLHVIDQAVRAVVDGSVTALVYEPETASLVSRPAPR